MKKFERRQHKKLRGKMSVCGKYENFQQAEGKLFLLLSLLLLFIWL